MMKKNKKQPEIKDEYKIIISDLGVSPLRVIRVAFALMGIIPVLIFFYIIIGKNFFYSLLLGSNGFIAIFSIYISIVGFFLAYNLVINMIKKLLIYSSERKQAEEEKTELLLAVTHDLKTPLTVVKTAMHNLLDGIGGAISKTHAELAKTCLNAINKITSFVNELLDISKARFVRMSFKRELVELEKIVKEEIEGVSELAKRNNNNVECKILASDSNLWADKQKLSRAVMNLLSNAINYTPQGGRIDVVISANEDAVKLAVVNTGEGIMPDELDKLFHKYERLEKFSGIEGTGLGLSIVREIVDLHKGHLIVNSIPGDKTEFAIILPRDLRAKGRA